MTAPERAPIQRDGYFAVSRKPRYSLLFALPLLLAYQALAVSLQRPSAERHVRNGADVMLNELATLVAGAYGPMLLMTAIIGLSVIFVWRDIHRSGSGVRAGVFAGMLVEAAALAAVFGIVIGIVTSQLLGSLHLLMIPAQATAIDRMSLPTKLMLSLGAGLYEELLFRVLLVSALATGARVVLGLGRRGAGFFAAFVGALLFSAAHYVGPLGEPFQIQSFAFRAVSGLAFSGIYLLRGFGITAWTHALYDAYLLLG